MQEKKLNHSSKFQDIVLPAAGMGTRLFPETESKPKILVKVNGKTILEHQLDVLTQFADLKNIHLILGYKSEILKDFVNNLSLPFNVKFYLNNQFNKTGCSFSLMKVIPNLKSNFIYLNSDLIISKKSLSALLCSNKRDIILVRSLKNKKESVLQKVQTKNNKVIRMALTLEKPYDSEAVGPVKISSTARKKIISIYDRLDQEIKLQIPCYSLFGVYAQNNPFYTKTIKDNQWIEINDLIDLEKAKTKINKLNK